MVYTYHVRHYMICCVIFRCNIVTCPAPPSVSHATVSYTTTTYDSGAMYSCNTGYVMTGNAWITCQSDATWTVRPTCALVNCGSPPSISLGTVGACTTTYSSVCRYSCSSGYVMSGSSSITCQANAQWTGPPMCGTSVITCPIASTPPHAVQVGACTTAYNSRCYYNCISGYYMSGNNYTVCTSSGAWSSRPLCTERSSSDDDGGSAMVYVASGAGVLILGGLGVAAFIYRDKLSRIGGRRKPHYSAYSTSSSTLNTTTQSTVDRYVLLIERCYI